MTTLDEAWTKAAAEEVLGEENATNENVDAFYESDRSLILDKASRGRSLLAAPRDLAVVVDAAASPAIVPSQPAAPLAPLAPPASTPAAMDTRPPEPTAPPAGSPPADDQFAKIAELERELEALAVAKARSDELAAKEKERADREKERADREKERADHEKARAAASDRARAEADRARRGGPSSRRSGAKTR